MARLDAPHSDPDVAPAVAVGQWTFSPPAAYPPVNGLTATDTIDEDRVSIHVNLAAAVAIRDIASATHAITTDGDATAQKRSVTLASGRKIDNRDFVLRYKLAGDAIQAGLLSHMDDKGGTFSLLLEPPAAPAGDDITPREIAFVLDTSGSMAGAPIEASKAFMTQTLRALRPTDYFRIIRFSSSASELTSGTGRRLACEPAAGPCLRQRTDCERRHRSAVRPAKGVWYREDAGNAPHDCVPVGRICRQRS